jgi:hypothetical protein
MAQPFKGDKFKVLQKENDFAQFACHAITVVFAMAAPRYAEVPLTEVSIIVCASF